MEYVKEIQMKECLLKFNCFLLPFLKAVNCKHSLLFSNIVKRESNFLCI